MSHLLLLAAIAFVLATAHWAVVLWQSRDESADTCIKLGLRYDPKAPAAKKIRFFVNGAELTDYVTDTQIAEATFPDDEELTPVFLTKNAITNTESWIEMARRGDSHAEPSDGCSSPLPR